MSSYIIFGDHIVNLSAFMFYLLAIINILSLYSLIFLGLMLVDHVHPLPPLSSNHMFVARLC